MEEKYKHNLAKIAVKVGVNLQPDQILIINSPVECADFSRLLVTEAYKAGAKDVLINYEDQKISRLRYDNASEKTLSNIPDWIKNKYDWILENKAAIISIHATEPTIMAGVNNEKVKIAVNASQSVTAGYHQAIINNLIRWCVISVPTPSWAKQVFPNCEEKEAVERLWEAICKTSRTDVDDPIEAWSQHNANFKAHAEFLNKQQFDHFIFRNSLGTNLTVGMPENHIWEGGCEKAADNIIFNPNIPTEEVFCAPHRTRVNGTLVASHPLVYLGQIIDKFQLTFNKGRVVEYSAEKGEEALKNLINESAGSNYLGEIALVQHDSPISNLNLLFYNTLFDENASCHFALGSSYPTNIKNGTKMSEEELLAAGMNCSNTHVDFMIGTSDLSIIGVKKDGTEITVFEKGNWSI